MKTLKILTFVPSILLTQISFAQESKTNTDASGKKLILGAGLSSYSVGGGIGGNLKFDYLLNNKLSIGLNSMLSTNVWEDHTYYPWFSGDGVLKVDYHTGNAFAVMATSTFYIFGHNNYESKGGMYASLGLGCAGWKVSETVTSLASVGDSVYYKYDSDFGRKDFSCMIGIGGDRKLGPGRLYIELVNAFGIYGTNYSNYTYEKKPYWRSADNQKNTGFSYIDWVPFLNLGYHFYF